MSLYIEAIWNNNDEYKLNNVYKNNTPHKDTYAFSFLTHKDRGTDYLINQQLPYFGLEDAEVVFS